MGKMNNLCFSGVPERKIGIGLYSDEEASLVNTFLPLSTDTCRSSENPPIIIPTRSLCLILFFDWFILLLLRQKS